MPERRKTGTYLTNGGPQLRLLDVCGGLVIATQESYRRSRIGSLSGFMQIREDCEDVGRSRDAGRVRRRPNDEEMISPGVVAGGQCDSLVNGDMLRCRAISDGHIDYAILEVVDAVSCVTAVPCDSKGFGPFGNAVSNECIGESCSARRQPELFVKTGEIRPPSISPLCPAPPLPIPRRMDELLP